MLTGEKPLSPSQKRVRKERTGYANDLDKFLRRTLSKTHSARVFDPDAPPIYGRVTSILRKGSIVIYSNDIGKNILAGEYAVAVLSSDGTTKGRNAEISRVKRINPKAKRITLQFPLSKDHGDDEIIGLYPFEDKLL